MVSSIIVTPLDEENSLRKTSSKIKQLNKRSMMLGQSHAQSGMKRSTYNHYEMEQKYFQPVIS